MNGWLRKFERTSHSRGNTTAGGRSMVKKKSERKYGKHVVSWKPLTLKNDIDSV